MPTLRPGTVRRYAVGAASIAATALLWQWAVTGPLADKPFATVPEILGRLRDFAGDPLFWSSLGETFRVAAIGLVISVVLGVAWVPIALTALPQLADQDWHLGWEVWALFVFATLGPLVLTNELWFRSLDRIGPARATLAANLQPFVAAAIAVVLLSETLNALELAGGALIAAGILVARRRRASAPPSE